MCPDGMQVIVMWLNSNLIKDEDGMFILFLSLFADFLRGGI